MRGATDLVGPRERRERWHGAGGNGEGEGERAAACELGRRPIPPPVRGECGAGLREDAVPQSGGARGGPCPLLLQRKRVRFHAQCIRGLVRRDQAGDLRVWGCRLGRGSGFGAGLRAGLRVGGGLGAGEHRARSVSQDPARAWGWFAFRPSNYRVGAVEEDAVQEDALAWLDGLEPWALAGRGTRLVDRGRGGQDACRHVDLDLVPRGHGHRRAVGRVVAVDAKLFGDLGFQESPVRRARTVKRMSGFDDRTMADGAGI